MGESRGGEGRAGGPTTDQILAACLRTYARDGREIRELNVKRLSGTNVSLEVWLWGEPEPEEIQYFNYEEGDQIAPATPTSRGLSGKAKDR